MMLRKQENHFGSRYMRGDGGVAGEGRIIAVPNFHSWGKCTMPLTVYINSNWMSNPSSGLWIILFMRIL